jgi:flagellar basal body-associated protein FliL
MKLVRRKRPRLVTIILFPLLAIAFLAGFTATIFAERKEQSKKPKMTLQIRKVADVVKLEMIPREEEFQAH